MKTVKFLSFILFPFIISCNIVSFDKPMPLDGKTLTAFPDNLIGTYYSTDKMFDSTTYNERYYPEIYKKKDSVLIASVQIFINEKKVSYKKIEKKYYDTTKIDWKTISSEKGKDDTNREITGNYVLYKSIKQEKIIDLKKDVLKEKNGIYYLNINNDENNTNDGSDWIVLQIIKGKKGVITINMLSSDKLEELPEDFDIELKKSGFGSIIHNVTSTQFNYLENEKYFEKLLSLKKE